MNNEITDRNDTNVICNNIHVSVRENTKKKMQGMKLNSMEHRTIRRKSDKNARMRVLKIFCKISYILFGAKIRFFRRDNLKISSFFTMTYSYAYNDFHN